MKSDIQIMREQLQKRQGMTDAEIEQDYMWRLLNKDTSKTPMQSLIENIRDRATLLDELRFDK